MARYSILDTRLDSTLPAHRLPQNSHTLPHTPTHSQRLPTTPNDLSPGTSVTLTRPTGLSAYESTVPAGGRRASRRRNHRESTINPQAVQVRVPDVVSVSVSVSHSLSVSQYTSSSHNDRYHTLTRATTVPYLVFYPCCTSIVKGVPVRVH